MERTAESIAAGNLTERVPGENDTTEVGRLARTLNVMLEPDRGGVRSPSGLGGRACGAPSRHLRQFVADASHELRTPIAAVSAYAELFERGAAEQKEDLDRVCGGIRTETARMEHLVADLLLLARLDEGRPLETRSVDLVALVRRGGAHRRARWDREWPITFEASAARRGDGRRHPAPPGRRQPAGQRAGPHAAGHHRPGARSSRKAATADDRRSTTPGPGMDPEEAAHVFERFYRSDPSRVAEPTAAAGLGLSIVERHRRRARGHGLGRGAHPGGHDRSPCDLPSLPLPRSRLRRTGPRP